MYEYGTHAILLSDTTFTFMHLADAFIQSDLQLHSGYTFSLVCVFPGNRTHNLWRCWHNALPLSHTGTPLHNDTIVFLCKLYWCCKLQLWIKQFHPQLKEHTLNFLPSEAFKKLSVLGPDEKTARWPLFTSVYSWPNFFAALTRWRGVMYTERAVVYCSTVYSSNIQVHVRCY